MIARHDKTTNVLVLFLIVAFVTSLMCAVVSYNNVTSAFVPWESCTPYPTPMCTPNPNGFRIAFSSDRACSRTGSSDIYVMNADGTCPARLTDTWRDARRPQWSPDGTQILFESGTRIGSSNILYVMNADGSDIRQIANCRQCDSRASWSSDGDLIAFLLGNKGSNCQLHIMGMNETRGKMLVDLPLSEAWSGIGWSPDGTQIAFSTVDHETEQREVYVVNVDGTGLTNLTNHPSMDDFVAWSPDGRQMLFVSDRDVKKVDNWGRPVYSERTLYIMDADGTNVQGLLDGVGYHPGQGTWIPSSDSQIVVDWNSDWHVVDIECVLASSTGPGNLPQECRRRLPEELEPSRAVFVNWPPGGKQFSYEGVDTGTNAADIFVVNFDGTGLMNLTDCPAYDMDPAWSP